MRRRQRAAGDVVEDDVDDAAGVADERFVLVAVEHVQGRAGYQRCHLPRVLRVDDGIVPVGEHEVGVRIFDSASRTSWFRISSRSATAISGLAAARRNRPNQLRSCRLPLGTNIAAVAIEPSRQLVSRSALKTSCASSLVSADPLAYVEYRTSFSTRSGAGLRTPRPRVRPRSSRSGWPARHRWRRGPPPAARRRSRPTA